MKSCGCSERDRFDQLADRANGANLASVADGETLSGLADELLALGAPIVAIKLGDQGLYLRTAVGPLEDCETRSGRIRCGG